MIPPRPDIILVMSDEHSPQFSSIYGHPIVRTPNMSRLAAQGAVFDAAYCASPICVPSRMAMLTGQLPSRTEAWDNGTPLRSDIPTIAHILRAQGYETALIGKMHFIGPDQRHGFETRLVDDSRVCGNWIDTNDWDKPDLPRPRARDRITNAGAGRTPQVENDEDVLAASLELLRQRASEPGRRPLFLCVSFNAPHFPLRAPDHFESYWPDNVDAPILEPGELEQQHPFHKRLRSYFDVNGLEHEEVLKARAAFFALVTWFDGLLGHVVDTVDETIGKSAETPPLVIYASDHGDMAGEHGLWWKCCFFEESVRVPLVIRWPGVIEPGSRIGEPVSLIDLSLTLAEIAGARDNPLADPFFTLADGSSFLGRLAGEAAPEREVISEYLAHAAGLPIRMLRQGRWKYVYYHGEPDELYDLESDPRERRNFAQSSACAGIVSIMRERLLRGWDPERINRRVREHQTERLLITTVEGSTIFE